jgi:hypothetical protein
MKAILVWNLPEEQMEYEVVSRGMAWALTLWELDQYLRNQLKYHDGSDDLQVVRDKLYELLEERQLSLDMVQ